MTSHDRASDSALAALMATSDPAVSSMSSESAVAKLRESYLIEKSRRIEIMNEADKAKLAESMRRDVLGVYNALLNDDHLRLLLFSASLCAKIELSQDEWTEHNSSVADNCELLLVLNRHLPSLSFQIRPARRSLRNGVTVRHADFPTSADNAVEGREAILDQLVTSGLRQRLMRWYAPYRRQRLQ